MNIMTKLHAAGFRLSSNCDIVWGVHWAPIQFTRASYRDDVCGLFESSKALCREKRTLTLRTSHMLGLGLNPKP